MPRLNQRGFGNLRTWITPALYLAVVFFPIAFLLYKSSISIPENASDLVVPSGRTLVLYGRSVLLGADVSLMTLLIGVPVGVFLWRHNRGPFFHTRWALLAILAVPPEIHALAWNTVARFLMEQAGDSGGIPQGWSMLVWCKTVSLFPIVAGMTLVVLESIHRDLIDASRLVKNSEAALVRVLLPLCAPVILASAGLVFVLTITDTTVPVLYQVNVYSFELFSEFSSGGDATKVFLLSIPLLLVAGLVIYAAGSGIRTVAVKASGEQSPVHASSDISFIGSLLLWISFAVLFVCFALPPCVLAAETGRLAELSSAFGNSVDETVTTFLKGLLTAALAIPVGLGGARLIRNNAMWFLVVLPLAIPAPLVGIGMIETWNNPVTGPVYTSMAMPILVSLARFAPIAAILLYAQEARMDRALIDASRIMKTSSWNRFARVIIPLTIPGLVVSSAVIFALTVAELGASMLVTPPGQTTLIMKIYNYLHYGSSSGVAALSILLVAVIIAGILALFGLGRLLIHTFRLR